MIRNILLLFGVLAIIFFSFISTSPLQTSMVSSAENDAIIRAAHGFLEHRNQQLIFGSTEAVVPALKGISEGISARVAHESALLRERAARLAGLGERYSGFHTEVRVKEAKKVNGKFVALVEEMTRFDYVKVHGSEPPFTAFQVDRWMTLSSGNDGLVIEELRLAYPGGFPPNERSDAKHSTWY